MYGARRMLLRFLSRKARPYLRSYGLLQTAKIFNTSALVWEPGNQRVVVLAPHMDDETIGCGGTLAAHVARGSRITAVFLTDCTRGGRAPARPDGTRGEMLSEAKLSKLRQDEARRALGILGVQEMIFLNGRDGSLAASPRLVARLRAILLEARPAIVYLPCFLEEHPDHRAVSELLVAASEGLPFDFQCNAYEVWTPLFPNCLVNIDATMDIKRRAISEYATQLEDSDYLHSAVGLNAYRSAGLLDRACRFAEAFLALARSDYKALYVGYRRAEPV